MKTIDDHAIKRFTSYFKAKGRQSATLDSYQRDCESFVKYLEQQGIHTSDISPKTLDDFKDYLRIRGSKDNSIRRSVIGIRQFFRFLQVEQGWDQSPFDDVVIPERDERFNHRLTESHMEALLNEVRSEGSELKSKRDLAMIYLLGFEGLKAAELIGIEWADFLNASQSGHLRIGGSKARTLSLETVTTEAIQSLKQTLIARGQIEMTAARAKLMVGFKGMDARHAESGLSRHGVKFALYELGQKINVSHLNSEDLRHFAMQHKVQLGFTPEMLMNHLGLRTPGKISRHFPDTLPPANAL